jgi:predicted amidohydrolase
MEDIMKAPRLILLVAPLVAGPAFGDPGSVRDAPIIVAQASSPRLVSSSSTNGRTIKVFAVGNGSPSVDVEQINDKATLKFGAHTILIAPDGRVSVDGKETSYGKFIELDVTIGDNDSIVIKVAN